MKKFICLFAFIGLGYIAAHAQNATVAAPTSPVSVDQVEAPKAEKPADAKAEKKADKKECAPSDKKQCSTSHSCCKGKKAEAKKEEKATPAP
jgi:hypothetical protein